MGGQPTNEVRLPPPGPCAAILTPARHRAKLERVFGPNSAFDTFCRLIAPEKVNGLREYQPGWSLLNGALELAEDHAADSRRKLSKQEQSFKEEMEWLINTRNIILPSVPAYPPYLAQRNSIKAKMEQTLGTLARMRMELEHTRWTNNTFASLAKKMEADLERL